MSVPRPSEEPACEGADPAYFTDSSVYRNPAVAQAALLMCHRCPVQSWCAASVDPIRSRADIIAAGSIFRNGVRIKFETLVHEWNEAEKLRRRRQAKEAQKALAEMMGFLKRSS